MSTPPIEYFPRTVGSYIASVLRERAAREELRKAELALATATDTKHKAWCSLKAYEPTPGVYTSKLGIPGGAEHAIHIVDVGAGCLGDYPEVLRTVRLEPQS